MGHMMLNPYLNFDGDTKAAMEYYNAVLGGKLHLQTFGTATGMDVPPGYEDKILHARLEADGLVLMAADTMPDMDVVTGNNVHLSLGSKDSAKLTKIFEELSEEGEITMPLDVQFWGDTFGMLTDKYGMKWMVNITKS